MKEKTTSESACYEPMNFPQLVLWIQGLKLPLLREEIEDLLARIVITPDDYKDYMAWNEPYGRVSVAKSEFNAAELLIMTWQKDQESPIHDHYTSACGIRVLKGVMTEELFAIERDDEVRRLSTQEWLEGNITSSEANRDIHRVSNKQKTTLVTIHIYSVPLDPTKMRRFLEID